METMNKYDVIQLNNAITTTKIVLWKLISEIKNSLMTALYFIIDPKK